MAPDGHEVRLTVPEGAVPGSQLEVEVPSAAVTEALKEEAMRALANRTEGLALQLAASTQAATSLQGQLAEQSVTLQQQSKALADGGADSGAGGPAEVGTLPPNELVEEVKTLGARLNKVTSELQAARQKAQEAERL
jgi:hypothetical protein